AGGRAAHPGSPRSSDRARRRHEQAGRGEQVASGASQVLPNQAGGGEVTPPPTNDCPQRSVQRGLVAKVVQYSAVSVQQNQERGALRLIADCWGLLFCP